MILATGSHRKDAGKSLYPAGKHWKKSENLPVGILLQQNHRNWPFLGRTVRPGYEFKERILFHVIRRKRKVWLY